LRGGVSAAAVLEPLPLVFSPAVQAAWILRRTMGRPEQAARIPPQPPPKHMRRTHGHERPLQAHGLEDTLRPSGLPSPSSRAISPARSDSQVEAGSSLREQYRLTRHGRARLACAERPLEAGVSRGAFLPEHEYVILLDPAVVPPRDIEMPVDDVVDEGFREFEP